MKGLKIKQIRNILQVRESFEFFKKSFLHMTQTEASAFLPMHEIYQTMVDNLNSKFKLQYFAELEDKVVGCVIAMVDKEKPSEVFLPVIAVDYKLRDAGIATLLLEEITKSLKKAKFNRIKVRSSATSAGFFIRAGFTTYLYIMAFKPNSVEDIKNANINNLPCVGTDQQRITLKFIAPAIDNKLILPFKRKLKNIASDFLLETRI